MQKLISPLLTTAPVKI